MKYTMTTPCSECPFLKKHEHAFKAKRLEEFASGEFPCHKSAECVEPDEDGEGGGYTATPESVHCAGALIYNEARGAPHQMARIAERLRMFDPNELDMDADVR